MNEFGPLNEALAADLVRQRVRSVRRDPRPVVARRTTRRSLASGLHRLADRLDT
jgi:hypothetical protein